MKRAERLQTPRSRQRSLCRVGVVIYFICAQWMPAVDSAFVAVEDKVTSPSRNEATNPLKEPTPSTLQGAFLGSNLTDDANNGSTSTPSAEASVASTTAAAAETVWNVRTAAVATLPADHRNDSATAAKLEPATTTNRPLESWESVVHTSTGRPSSPPHFGTDSNDDNNDNLMANMLKNWFDHKDDSPSADKGYYKLATEYLQDNGVGERENGNGGGPSKASSKTAKAAAASGGNKSLFERWDEASEEQERVLEDAMRSERTVGGSPSSVLAADHQNTPSRWFVLLLSGNSTVAQMRRTDFAKYLKLNLAARLSLEYDEVKINRVLVVPPRLMVNVSVVPVSERASAAAPQHVPVAEAAAAAAAAADAVSSSSWPLSVSDAAVSDRVVVVNDDPLHNLVETNATLMELSGEEYRVERFMSLKSQKPQSTDEAAATVSDRHADIDFFIYATVGPLCFVVVLGFASFALYKCARKHPVRWPWKRKFRHPSFWPGGDHHHHAHRRMTDGRDGGASVDETDDGDGGGGGGSVNVIYSGEFEQSQQQQLSGSWLDDASFVPDDSLDRIRTPTLLRTPAAKNKTFTDMVHGQCGDGGIDDMRRRRGQCASAAAVPETAVHAQSPRLGRDNKLRILGCKQSCLLLPAVQPAADYETTTTTVLRENDRP